MGTLETWEFGEAAAFDGRDLYSEVRLPERRLPCGTIEIIFCAAELRRATLLAQGRPGRDRGAFTLTLTHRGAVALTCSDAAGAPWRFRTADGFVAARERIQATVSWGRHGAFTVVNLDRRRADPADPAASHVRDLPHHLDLMARGGASLTFGAAAGGEALFFHGCIDRVTLSDRVDRPTVAPATARILRPCFNGGRSNGTPAAGPLQRAAGLLVATLAGDRPIADIGAGDRVLTRDHGAVPVLSNLRIEVDAPEIGRHPRRPRILPAGALGHGLPESDIVLGPLQRLPGAADARCVPAQLPPGEAGLVYHHLILPESVTIWACGFWIEMHQSVADLVRRHGAPRAAAEERCGDSPGPPPA